MRGGRGFRSGGECCEGVAKRSESAQGLGKLFLRSKVSEQVERVYAKDGSCGRRSDKEEG